MRGHGFCGLIPRLLTTSYWSYQDGAGARMEQGPLGTGPTRRRSTCEKDHARAKMDQKQSKHDHG